MRLITSPKSTTRQSSRQPLVIPHKNISIGTFFNQKLDRPSKVVYIHCSNSSSRNQIKTSYNHNQIGLFSPNPTTYNRIKSNFGFHHSHKDGLGKILRYTNPVFVNKMRKKSLPDDRTRKSTIVTEQSKVNYVQIQLNNNKGHLLDNSGIENVRKQLEEKFNRTRIILKQEQKLQRYQKIQKIYENKFQQMKMRAMKKASIDESDKQSNFSPWNKHKVQNYDVDVDQIEPQNTHEYL